MRRKTACLRELHPLQKDMFRLPTAAPERKALRGDQDRSEAAGRDRCGRECGTTSHPRTRATAPKESGEISAAEHAPLDPKYPACNDDAVPPFDQSPIQ